MVASPSRGSGRAGWQRAAAKHWAEIEEARRSDAGEESPAKQAGARKISHQTSQLSMHQTVGHQILN